MKTEYYNQELCFEAKSPHPVLYRCKQADRAANHFYIGNDSQGKKLCICGSEYVPLAESPYQGIEEICDKARTRTAAGEDVRKVVYEIVEGYKFGWQSANAEVIQKAAEEGRLQYERIVTVD